MKIGIHKNTAYKNTNKIKLALNFTQEEMQNDKLKNKSISLKKIENGICYFQLREGNNKKHGFVKPTLHRTTNSYYAILTVTMKYGYKKHLASLLNGSSRIKETNFEIKGNTLIVLVPDHLKKTTPKKKPVKKTSQIVLIDHISALVGELNNVLDRTNLKATVENNQIKIQIA